MDTVVGFLNQQNSFKVKAVSQVQLALALIATAWEPNLSGAVAVLGILASVLGSHELLQLYMYFTPASIVIDVFQIIFFRPVGFGMWFGVMFLNIIAKMFRAGLVTVDDEAGYQSFAGGGQGTRSQRDPFSGGYQPPPTNPFVQPSAGGSPPRNAQNQDENA
ncbi:MAG: hypothetical protein FRX49_04289 [Trebouxia sp. A1-2]|nr:MAG: hypothetical protein FRX49_04289 [Trebouxia sp. A1-2]